MRYMSIPIREKRIKVQEKEGFVEYEGNRKRTTFQAKTAEWINPDEEVAEDAKLIGMPDDSEIFPTEELDK